MADITQPMQLATSTPQEAADHIDNANAFNVDADTFKQYKDQLQPEIDQRKLPSQASDTVSKYVSQSSEHAALAAPDSDKLSYMDKRWKYLGDQINKVPTTERKLNDLAFKKMFNKDQFTPTDELQLAQYNGDLNSQPDYGVGAPDSNTPLIDKAVKGLGFLGQIARGMGQAVDNNFTAITGTTAAFASVGAVAGSPVGGIGAVPGAISAGAMGLSYSTMAAMAWDGATQQMGSTYNMLSEMTTERGKIAGLNTTEPFLDSSGKGTGFPSPLTSEVDQVPLNIDETTKRNISMGVGAAIGALSFVGGRTVAKTVPFLEAMMGRKGIAEILASPGKEALKQALGNFGKAVAAGGIEGGSQEFVKTIGEEMGKTFDGTEASFISGLNNAVTKIPQNAERIGMAAAGNMAAAGTFSAVGNALSFNANKTKFNNEFYRAENVTSTAPKAPNLQITDVTPIKPKGGGGAPTTPVDHAVDVLHLDSAIKDVQKVSNTTEMKKIAPGQLFQLRKSMMEEAGVNNIYLDKEDLTKFADSPEKAADVKNILSPEGEAQAATNAPIQVEGHKFLELVEKYPDSAELAKLTPEGPNSGQAKKYLEDMSAAGEKRKEILDKLKAKEITPADAETLKQALDTEQPFRMYPSNEVFGEAEYLKQPSLHEAIQKIMPDGSVDKYSKAQLAARESVAQNIHETATHEMDHIVDITTREAMDAEYQSQLERLSNDPNLAIVDKFVQGVMKPDTRYETPSRATEAHVKPGYSPLAIDPRLMTDNQKALYARDPQMRAHKAFVKGGISPDVSARLLGINSGDTLLRVLSSTPSRSQAAEIRTNARKADIEANARESVDLNQTAIIQAYNDNTANHIAELKFMREKKWPDLKGGIKKIALPLPTKEGLRAQAESAVGSTQVGKLNVNQFKVGERKSQRLAVDSILNNQVEKAFVNKQAAALNSELTRSTMIATGKVNRVLKLARQLDRPENVQLLKDTGFDKAANEILDVANLSTKKKGTSEKDAFIKFVEKSLNQGEAVTEIPERFQDVRQNLSDMTVDQVLAYGDALQNIFHQAKMKNKLYTKHDAIRVLQTIEGFANALEEQGSQSPDYNPKNLQNLQPTSKKIGDKVGDVLEAGTHLRRSQNLLVTLDLGKDSGLANDLFWQPIKQGNAAEVKMAIDFEKQQDAIIEKFGKKDFQDLRSQVISVPEFKSIPSLKDGQISKAELLKMNLNRGNEGNLKALERFNIDRDVFKTVIERELGEHRYMELTQRIWDMNKSLESEIAKLQKETQGVDVKFVQAIPLEFTDKNGDTRTYPGGYFPIQTISDKVKNKAEWLVGSTDLKKADSFRQKFYSHAQTEQGHLEARTTNTAVLDLGLEGIGRGFAQTIHDLTMRVPVRDTAKLLADKSIRETIVKVLGKDGYSALANMVASEVNGVDSKAESEAGGFLVNTGSFLMKNFSAAHILIKAGSIVIQAGSIPFVIDRIPSGGKHFAATIAKLPGNFKVMTEFAEKYHAPLRDSREGFEGDIAHRLNKIMPPDKWVKGTDWVRSGNEIMTEMGFHALQQVDNMNKVIAFHTAYRAAMNGDVPHIAIADHDEAVKYASNVTELVTTHSANRNLSEIQREKWIKPMVMFYNDASIVLNHMIDKAKQAKKEGKQGYNSFKGGDYAKGFKYSAAAVGTMMSTMLAATVLQMWEKGSKGKQALPYNDDDDAQTAIAKSIKYFATAPVEQMVGGVPFFKDADYTLDFQALTHKKQKLEPPPLKIGNTFIDTYTGLKAALDFSEDSRDVTDAEKKSFLYSAGYLRGIPSDAIYKYVLQPDWSNVPAQAKGELQLLTDKIDHILTIAKGLGKSALHGGAPVTLNDSGDLSDKQIEELKFAQSLPPEAIQQLEQYRNDIDPSSVREPQSEIPTNTLEVIKKIESDGKWWAKNPNSSAAGLYQFTESTWSDLMNKYPELGLTEAGRTSKNTAQQEKAMEQFTTDSIKKLTANDIPVTVENVYAAHFLGSNGAVEVLGAPETMKLKTLVGPAVMKANNFKSTWKVSDFKNWLTDKVAAAEVHVETEQAAVDKQP